MKLLGSLWREERYVVLLTLTQRGIARAVVVVVVKRICRFIEKWNRRQHHFHRKKALSRRCK